MQLMKDIITIKLHIHSMISRSMYMRMFQSKNGGGFIWILGFKSRLKYRLILPLLSRNNLLRPEVRGIIKTDANQILQPLLSVKQNEAIQIDKVEQYYSNHIAYLRMTKTLVFLECSRVTNEPSE